MSYGKVLKGKVQEEDISSYWKFELLKYWKSIASNSRVIWKQFELLKVRVIEILKKYWLRFNINLKRFEFLKIRVIESSIYWKFELWKFKLWKFELLKFRYANYAS